MERAREGVGMVGREGEKVSGTGQTFTAGFLHRAGLRAGVASTTSNACLLAGITDRTDAEHQG